jgi:hypothetical protein
VRLNVPDHLHPDLMSGQPRHIFDKDGKVISDPAADPSANAFEPNPRGIA